MSGRGKINGGGGRGALLRFTSRGVSCAFLLLFACNGTVVAATPAAAVALPPTAVEPVAPFKTAGVAAAAEERRKTGRELVLVEELLNRWKSRTCTTNEKR